MTDMTPAFPEYQRHVSRLKKIDPNRHVAIAILMLDDPAEANRVLIAERNTVAVTLEIARRLLEQTPPNVGKARAAIVQAMRMLLGEDLPSQSERQAVIVALDED
jgi:hypothetical protein